MGVAECVGPGREKKPGRRSRQGTQEKPAKGQEPARSEEATAAHLSMPTWMWPPRKECRTPWTSVDH